LAEQQRALVSHYAASCRRSSGHSGTLENTAGVFLVHQGLDMGTAIEELLLIWLASDASEWENRLEWLPL
jgi:hypothetical protein